MKREKRTKDAKVVQSREEKKPSCESGFAFGAAEV
jgi:hypothetical protein